MRSHATLPPRAHGRAAARDQRSCSEGQPAELDRLAFELALACLEGVALGQALMTLQDVADESEARAMAAVAATSDPAAEPAAMKEAMDAAASFARASRAEFAAAIRWVTHVVESSELAGHALRVTGARV